MKFPDIEPLCVNILLKLLMKKALFKPNTKIGENFELAKFNEMLFKKILFFYKTYIRHLKKLNNEIDNTKIFELINKDIDSYREKSIRQKYDLTASNLSENIFEESDIKLLIIVEFFRGLGGRNPLMKTLNENFEMILSNENQEEEKVEEMSDFLSFSEISLQDRVNILYFFCNYALTFSGRAPFFREEILRDNKDTKNLDQNLSHLKYKRIKSLGSDMDGKLYYFLECNKDCRIYRETFDYGIEIVVKNYEELENFLAFFGEGHKSDKSKELIKNLKEHLILLKEYSEEENKKDQNFLRKQQVFEKAKKLNVKPSGEVEKFKNSDYFLMSVSDHVITRNQLHQITRTSLTSKNNNLHNTKTALTEDERKKIKIEKEKIERQKRLEKRNRIVEKQMQSDIYAFNEVNSKEEDQLLSHKRDRKKRKKIQKNDSSEEEYSSSSVSLNHSEEVKLESDKEEAEEEILAYEEDTIQNDIVLEGNLIYRYANNQVELEGLWYMSADPGTKEKFSYLFQNSNDYTDCLIRVEGDDLKEENFNIKICSPNIFELIAINRAGIFENVLKFLCGEYAGYFMYYGKTIEDRVNLTFNLEESLVRVNGSYLITLGDGINNLGNFSTLGYMNFYRQKELLIEKNDLNSEVIKLSEFKFTKVYTAFNPNENYRVIKSYQHRRKKCDENFNY